MKKLSLICFMIMVTFPTLVANAGWYDKNLTQGQRDAVAKWFATDVVAACCKEGDAFEADEYEVTSDGTAYIAQVTDGTENEWRPGLRTGIKIPVPNSQVKWSPPNPTGHGVLFLRRGWNENDPLSIYVYCYFPPSGL